MIIMIIIISQRTKPNDIALVVVIVVVVVWKSWWWWWSWQRVYSSKVKIVTRYYIEDWNFSLLTQPNTHNTILYSAPLCTPIRLHTTNISLSSNQFVLFSPFCCWAEQHFYILYYLLYNTMYQKQSHAQGYIGIRRMVCWWRWQW